MSTPPQMLWRTGGHSADEPGPRKRTIYSLRTGELIGVFFETEDAELAVSAVNGLANDQYFRLYAEADRQRSALADMLAVERDKARRMVLETAVELRDAQRAQAAAEARVAALEAQQASLSRQLRGQLEP